MTYCLQIQEIEMKTILSNLGKMIAQVIVFLVFFVMLGIIAVLAEKSISAVSEYHWVVGVFVGVIWLIGVLILCFAIWYAMRPSAPKWLSNYMLIHKKTGKDAGLAEQYPAASLSALICVAMLTAVFALTGLSTVLASQGILTYSIDNAHQKPMTELLFRLYMWHTIDMIPFIDIWKTYDIKPPIQPVNLWAQSIVLVFRTAIIGFAISVIVQWVKFNRDLPLDKNAPNK
jgi:hypothetical protein